MSRFDIAALRARDEAAWSAFLGEHDPLIRRVVSWSKWRFPAHVAGDLEQDIRAELMRAMDAYHGECDLSYFVKRVCVHRCVDRIRQQVRDRQVMVSMSGTDEDGNSVSWDPPAGEAFDPVREVMLAERAAAMKMLVDGLDATCGEAIRMFYLNGLSYAEIARRLGITVNTVGSRLSKCLEKLRGLVAKEDAFREETGGARRPMKESVL